MQIGRRSLLSLLLWWGDPSGCGGWHHPALPWSTAVISCGVTAIQDRWILGLTRESLFEILARSETRFLDPKFSRDFRETRESKLVARLASCESHRQKFRCENCKKRVLIRNFVAKIASDESRRKKFRSKTRFSQVSQTNFVARLARIIANFNSGVFRESCENFESNTNFSLWIMTLLGKCETHNQAKLASLTIYRIFPFLWDSWDSRDLHWYFREKRVSFSTKFSREKLRNETRCQP